MPFDKNYFKQFKEEIEEEHKVYETHLENQELSTTKCNHKGKVQVIPGGLRCQCGAGWQGARLNTLLDYFNKGV